MPEHIKGASRLVIGKFLYDWHNQEYCLIAYATRGHDGMGVVGTMPDADGNAPDLWSTAARHLPLNASIEDIGRWCLGAGWARSNHPRHSWIETEDEKWTLAVRNTLKDIKPHQYGNTAFGWLGAYVGVMTVDDVEVTRRAHALLS
ncbi:hypothetical protein ACWGBV_03110 [Streptomyces sp. NPDC055051]